MTINVSWDDTVNTIIRVDYHDTWEWSDYDQAMDQANKMAAGTPLRVDLIINTLDGSIAPKGNSLWHIRRAMRLSPANLGFTVTVGVRQNSFFKSTIMSTVFRLFPKAAEHAAFASSLEEARTLISAQRQKVKLAKAY